MPKQKASVTMSASTQGKRKKGGLAEGVRVVLQALLIALVIRTLLFQPFNIPSGSMKGTLLIGDYLFVSQFSYGYSRYSLPLSLPLFSGRMSAATWWCSASQGTLPPTTSSASSACRATASR